MVNDTIILQLFAFISSVLTLIAIIVKLCLNKGCRSKCGVDVGQPKVETPSATDIEELEDELEKTLNQIKVRDSMIELVEKDDVDFDITDATQEDERPSNVNVPVTSIVRV